MLNTRLTRSSDVCPPRTDQAFSLSLRASMNTHQPTLCILAPILAKEILSDSAAIVSENRPNVWSSEE